MNKKYELFEDNYINHDERILYRIRALITFVDINDNIINAGELGGYIENESNLSQEDKSWVYGNSKVYGDTIIRNSIIKDSIIKDSIINKSWIEESAIEESFIYDSTIVNSYTYSSHTYDSFITKAIIKNNVNIKNRRLTGEITISFKDVFQHQCRKRLLTAILTEDDRILYSIGCQHNITEEEFIDRIHNKDGGLEKNPHRAEYLKLIPAINIYFKGRMEYEK